MPLPTGISRATRNGANVFVAGALTTKLQTTFGIPAGTTAFALPPANIGAPGATEFTVQVDAGGTGAFSALAINILGSIDGVSFYPTGTVITTVSNINFFSLLAVKYLAASITTATVGSGAPSVTVSFAINR